MPEAAELLGEEFTIYYDSAADFDTSTWVLLTSAGDAGFNPNNEIVEIPIRASFKAYKKGRSDWEFTFPMNMDKTNAIHVALSAAVDSGNPIHLAFADGPIATAGTIYRHAWWLLSGPISAGLDSPGTQDITAKVHHNLGEYGDEVPTKVTVST